MLDDGAKSIAASIRTMIALGAIVSVDEKNDECRRRFVAP
jgi:hypothetical protein